ncbi:SDR family oxidoreductase [Paenibacillus monticola]|uniref:SDR family NAD(P)-dependent oxidoreductase n=1 Tax=Paenibacillus monticola TaxID=2666075 RepID=A0A7X2H8E1_9BACL|nr:SDR family oxidoreductase [Paenibacillus monticola]MRN55333.1 SDR family NAD(P)-dependent oxidoreductase [Paenibacillus monticola]
MKSAKTVLITGANKGIGYETARQLGALGYIILIGSRNEEKGQKAIAALKKEGVNAHFIQLDLADQATIEAAAKQIEQQFSSLDILVNNAGISLGAGITPSQFKLSDLRETYETNFFGTIAVIQAMLPLLQQSPAARIVNLSSGLGSLTYNSDPEHEFSRFNLLAYNSSKTALNAATIIFAKEFKDSPLKINAADPGYTATGLNGFRGLRSVQQAAGIVIRLATLEEDGPTGGFFDENGEVPW